MWWTQTYIGPELGRELSQMRQSRSNDQTAYAVTNEADLANTRNWAEGEDILLDLGGQSFSHLHYVTFRLVFITLRQ